MKNGCRVQRQQAPIRGAAVRKHACTPSEADVSTYIRCPHRELADHQDTRCQLCKQLKEFSICSLKPTHNPGAMPRKSKGVVTDTLTEEQRKIGKFLLHTVRQLDSEKDARNFNLSHASWAHVAAYCKHLEEEGKSAGHILRMIFVLSKLMNWAKSSGYQAYGSATSSKQQQEEQRHRKDLHHLSPQLKARMLRDQKAQREVEQVPYLEDFLEMQQSVDERTRTTLLAVLLRVAEKDCQTDEEYDDMAAELSTQCDTFHQAVEYALEQLESGQLTAEDVNLQEAKIIQSSIMLSLLLGYHAPLRMTCVHPINLPGQPRAHWCKEYKCPATCKGNCLLERERNGEPVLVLHLPHNKFNMNGSGQNSGIIEFEPSPEGQNLLRLAISLTQPALAEGQTPSPARLFLNCRGKPFTTSSASKWFQRLWEKHAPEGSVWTSAQKIRHAFAEAVGRNSKFEYMWDTSCPLMGTSKAMIKAVYDRGRHKRLCQEGAVQGRKFYQHIKAGMSREDQEEQPSPWDEEEEGDISTDSEVARLKAEVARLQQENQKLQMKLQQATQGQGKGGNRQQGQAVPHKQLCQLDDERQQWRLAPRRSQAAADASRGNCKYPLRSRSPASCRHAPAAAAAVPAAAMVQAADSKQVVRRAVQPSNCSSRTIQMKRVGATQARARPVPELQAAEGRTGVVLATRVTRSSTKASSKPGRAERELAAATRSAARAQLARAPAAPRDRITKQAANEMTVGRADLHCGIKRRASTDSHNISSRYPKRVVKV